ncbi:hypothetical protein HMPREF9421_1109 [Streptococcus australis ATCC 700641]|uniref:Uncharacterized protein n=1 Tax=Streptococcus australis ATCC 700641 TaxID=888833 RepID=E7SC50_9STRE|nr:hypothetical protein HMPREF9421_1109 [Streptococcus australis ATCC 700641]
MAFILYKNFTFWDLDLLFKATSNSFLQKPARFPEIFPQL